MTSDRWHWGQKAQLLKFNQLEAARRQADSWRTGLTGVTALLSAVLVVKGRDNVSALAPPYPLLVLLCFLAALAALVVATLAALRAASGVPGDECLLTAEDLEAWSKAETAEVYRWIAVARRLTVGGVCLIATGAAIAWLAPANLWNVLSGAAANRVVTSAPDEIVVMEIVDRCGASANGRACPPPGSRATHIQHTPFEDVPPSRCPRAEVLIGLFSGTLTSFAAPAPGGASAFIETHSSE